MAAAIQVVKFVNGDDADTPTGPLVAEGSTLTFTYVVTNTGDVPLNTVVVTDDRLGAITSFTGDANGDGVLDLTETWTYTQTATALDDQQTNIGTVTAADVNDPLITVTDNNPANYFGDVPAIQIVKFVNGQDADDMTSGPHVVAGSTVTFSYVVTNTGNVPLGNVVVTDDQLGTLTSFTGDTNSDGQLDLTETWLYALLDLALPGQQTNLGTVTAQDPNNPGATVSDANPANYFGDARAPAINIVKFVNGQDADSPTGPHVVAGSTVTFSYVVTNTGNVPLGNVVVTDDKLGTLTSFTGDTNSDGQLDLTETWLYALLDLALPGQQTNLGTVTAQDPNNPGATVSDANPANYFGDARAPAINIVKFVNGQDADSPTGPHVVAGSTVTFSYVVTNTGNVPLGNVVVTDDKLGTLTSFTGDTNSDGQLDLTETWLYALLDLALPGQQTNLGTVTAQDPNNPGATVSDANPANYFGDARAPAINIVKFVNGQDADSPTGPHVVAGSTVTFSYVVTNTGNVPLGNVVVTDDKLGTLTSFTGDTNSDGQLDLTETWLYALLDLALPGQQTNLGTVTAQDPNNPGATVSDANPANYFGDARAPAINIVKFVNGQDADSPTGPHVAVGSFVTFTYVVTDTGNVPLANVVVTDDHLGAITSFTGDTNSDGQLGLTETWTYTTTATALAGQQTNLGTVNGRDPNTGATVSDANPANYFGDARAPAINIVKFVNGQDADSPTGPHVAAGSTVTFTYVVTDTGNVPLANVVVTDDHLGAITSFTGDTNSDGQLGLTETWTYTTTATALAGQQTNLGTVNGRDPNTGATVSDANPANYFGGTTAFVFALPTFQLSAFGPSAGGWSSDNTYPRALADVSGDGLADIVGFSSAGVYEALATGGGHFAAPTFELAAFGTDAGGWSSDNTYPRELADVNGDTRADIVGFSSAGVYESLATGNGDFMAPTFELAAFGTNAGGWSSDDTYPRELADVNGDSMADIVGFGQSGVYVSLATAGGNFAMPTFELAAFGATAGGWSSDNTYPRELADVNGDGKADIVGFGADGVFVSLATGGGHFAAPTFELAAFGTAADAGGWTSQDLYPRTLADVNADHVADIVGFGADGVFVSLATGGGHFASPTFQLPAFGPNAGGWNSDNTYPRQLADISGNGAADIVGFATTGVWTAPSLSLT